MSKLLPGSIVKSLVSQDGINIYYDVNALDNGKKFLVFLHGLGGDFNVWNEERKAFRTLRYSSIAIDLRGHGLSEHPDKEESYDLDNFALDILEVIKREKVKKAVVIGHCFGGMVALTLEGKHPKTADALILVDTSYKPPQLGRFLAHHVLIHKLLHALATRSSTIGITAHRDFSNFLGTTDYDKRRILSDIIHTSLKSYLLAGEQLVHFTASDLLKRIAVPTLIVEGTKDSIFPPEVARELHERIKHSELELVKDAAHMIVINNPDDLIPLIHRFLQKIEF